MERTVDLLLSRRVVRICGVWLSLCVCSRLASRVSRLCASVHVKGSKCVRLASVCVCSRQGFQMRAPVRQGFRMCAFASRVCSRQGFRMRASACVYVRLRLARVCLRLCASARVSRLLMLRVPNACVCVSRLSRVCLRLCHVKGFRMLASVCPCECLRELAHFMRRSSFKEFKRFLLSSYYRCTYRLYEQTFNILI